jgi:hypothetical protein
MHWQNQPDGLSDPGRDDEWGGEYGPYVIDRFTVGLAGRRSRIYFVMSTWNPYNTVEMTVTLQRVDHVVTRALDGYWGADNSQHVNFVSGDGHIHELYIHPGAGWVDDDLTTFSKGTQSPGHNRSAFHRPNRREDGHLPQTRTEHGCSGWPP